MIYFRIIHVFFLISGVVICVTPIGNQTQHSIPICTILSFMFCTEVTKPSTSSFQPSAIHKLTCRWTIPVMWRTAGVSSHEPSWSTQHCTMSAQKNPNHNKSFLEPPHGRKSAIFDNTFIIVQN